MQNAFIFQEFFYWKAVQCRLQCKALKMLVSGMVCIILTLTVRNPTSVFVIN